MRSALDRVRTEFRAIAGFDLPERRMNHASLRVVRLDRTADRLAELAFDDPRRLARLRRRTDRWTTLAPCETTWALAGTIAYCSDDWRGAARAFLRAIEDASGNLDNWFDLGFALHHLADPLGEAILFDGPLFVREWALSRPRRCTLAALRRAASRVSASAESLYRSRPEAVRGR